MNEVTRGWPLRLALVGFGVCAIGAALAFAGSLALGSMLMARSGFVLVVIGVVLGFIGIIWGQIRHGREAVVGSVEATKDLHRKLFHRGEKTSD